MIYSKQMTILFLIFVLLPLNLFSQNITIDKRVFTPVEGKQMANAYGFIATIQGNVKLTIKNCNKWLPDKKKEFKQIYSKWLNRNRTFIKQNASMYSDLVKLVSLSSGKRKKDIELFYREMTSTAIKQYKTILLRKDQAQRKNFCHNFTARLVSKTLDIVTNKSVSQFVTNYVPIER